MSKSAAEIDAIFGAMSQGAPPPTGTATRSAVDEIDDILNQWRPQKKYSSLINFMRNTEAIFAERLGYDVGPDPDMQRRVQDVRKLRQAAKQMGEDESTETAMGDFLKFWEWKLFENPTETAAKIKTAGASFLQSARENPGAAVVEMGKAMVTPIGDMFETRMGVNLFDDEMSILTPEERVARTKNVIATAASMAVGVGAAKAIGRRAMARNAVLKEGIDAAMPDLAGVVAETGVRSTLGRGAFAREVLNKTAISAASGATYGLVRFAGEEDQLAEILINGVLFAPLGVAFEVSSAGKATKLRKSQGETAMQLMHLKQLRAIESRTFPQLVSDIEGMSNADDLVDALIQRVADAKDGQPIVVPGLSMEKVAKVSEKVPRGLKMRTYVRDDGALDVWVGGSADDPGAIFEKVGFAENQIVQYQGKTYVVRNGSVAKGKRTVTLEDITSPSTGDPIEVAGDDLFRHYTSMSAEQLSNVARDMSNAKRNFLATIFGEEGANQYLKDEIEALRSSTPDERVQAIRRNAEAMVSKLSPEQKKRLDEFERFAEDFTEDDVREAAATANAYGPGVIGAIPTDSLLSNVGRELTTGKPTKDLSSAIILRNGIAELMTRTNMSLEDVINRAVGERKLRGDVANTAQAQELLKRNLDDIRKMMGASKKIANASTPPASRTLSVEANLVSRLAGDEQFPRLAVPDVELTRFYNDWRRHIAERRLAESKLDKLVSSHDELNARAEALPDGDPVKETLKARVKRIAGDIKREQAKRTAQKSDRSTDQVTLDIDEDAPLTDVVPRAGESINTLFDTWAQQKGFDPLQSRRLKTEFSRRMSKELLSAELDPDDVLMVARAQDEFTQALARETEELSKGRTYTAQKLSRYAQQNGMMITDLGSSGIEFRDMETGALLHRTGDITKALEFITKSGAEKGIPLDGDWPLPADIVAGGLPPAVVAGSMDPIGDFGWRRPGKLSSIFDAFNISADFLTRYRDIFASYDNKYKTRLFAEVFNKLQDARRLSNGKAYVWIEELGKIDDAMRGLSAERRELITDFIETLAPSEVLSEFKVSGYERKLAENIARNNIDLGKVMAFRRSLKDAMDDVTPGTPEYDVEFQKALQVHKLDAAHQAIAAALDATEKMAKPGHTIGNITRYARSLMAEGGTGELTRAQFAVKHKFTAKELMLAKRIENMYSRLATRFGIPAANRLPAYVTHARVYENGDFGRTFNAFGGDVAAKDFYATLTRTGELSAVEKDPVRALARYIKGGFDAEYFHPKLAEAQNFFKAELKKLSPDNLAVREQLTKVVEQYYSDLRGFPSGGMKATQDVVDKMFDKLGMKNLSPDVRRQIVNVIAQTIPAATQGLRMVAGLRDFATGLTFMYARFGVKRTARMLQLGVNALKESERRKLHEAGDITLLSPVSMIDPVEEGASALRAGAGNLNRAWNWTTQKMFRLSGQQDVYTLLHAGTYLSGLEQADRVLTQFSRGEIDWKRARKELKLDTYDAPVAEEFVRLVKLEKNGEAARFLALQSGYETIGVFGLANQPYLWNTNIGRIAGQFGNWPMWARTTMQRMLSRGTWSQRAGTVARFAAVNQLVMMAGEEAGVDMATWNLLKAPLWAASPVFQSVYRVVNAIQGGGPEAEMAQRRLERMLPISGGEVNMRQLWFPGSYFAGDVARAIQTMDNEGNALKAVGNVVGFRNKE